MKLGLLLLAIAVLLGSLVGTLVVRDPGYVLVAYADAAFETSLWAAVVLLVIGYFLVRLAVYLLVRSASSRGRLGNWLQFRKDRSARERTARGLLLAAEGRWQQARKLLTTSATEAVSPLVNYLYAARAAQEMDDIDGRDTLLRQALESSPDAALAVGLTRARLQMSRQQWELSLATLGRLAEEAPRNPQVLKMLMQCQVEVGDYAALRDLLPTLKKAKVLTEAELQTLSIDVWAHSLESDTQPPAELWQRVPKEYKRDPTVVAEYVARLVEDGDAQALDTASGVLRGVLQHVWDDRLVELYGRVPAADSARQLATAEGWLKHHANDANLLLALGRIALMNHSWDQAREYLEASLRAARTPAVYAELGRLCAALGDSRRGSEFLVQAAGELPELPLPEAT